MLDTLKTYLKYTSWPIILAMVALMVVGVVAIGVSEKAEGVEGFAAKQAMFGLVALAAFVATTVVPYGKIGRAAYPLFALSILLLIGVFFLPAIRSCHRWIDLKFMLIQVSEIAKIAFIIMLAWYLRYRDNYRRLGGLVVPFVLTLVPMVLVLKEPDLGTSLLFLPTLYFMLFMAGARLTHLLVILAMGLVFIFVPVPRGVDMAAFEAQKTKFDSWELNSYIAGTFTFYSPQEMPSGARRAEVPVAYCRYQRNDGNVYDLQPLSLLLMKDHQIVRVEGLLRQNDPNIIRGKGYQLYLSKMILGSGRVTGRQGWNDNDSYFSMLPEDHTDFIFAVIGGQWGLLGCAGVFTLYLIIFILGVEIAVITDDPFGRLLAVGVLALLFTQLVVNVGMAMGLMPVTGMTLPLISYGGSSLVINCVALGILVNVGQRRTITMGPKPFEYKGARERPTPYDELT